LTSERRIILVVVLGMVAVYGGIMWLTQPKERLPRSTQPIRAEQAVALFDRTARMAVAGQWDAICEDIAEGDRLCRALLEGAKATGARPAPRPPIIVAIDGADTPLVLIQWRARRGGGSPDSGTFEVTWSDSTPGRLVSHNAIFWSNFAFEDPHPCPPSLARLTAVCSAW
jgi:hypothetical protein